MTTKKISLRKKKYTTDFGTRSDNQLGNYLKKQGYQSLAELLEIKENVRTEK